jgi:CheY-like chemotaxis protein
VTLKSICVIIGFLMRRRILLIFSLLLFLMACEVSALVKAQVTGITAAQSPSPTVNVVPSATTNVYFESALKLLDAISKLAWPLLAAALLWRLYPVLRKIFESRNFAIKVAGIDVSVQDASEQLAKQIQELQDQFLNLRNQIPQTHAGTGGTELPKPPADYSPSAYPQPPAAYPDRPTYPEPPAGYAEPPSDDPERPTYPQPRESVNYPDSRDMTRKHILWVDDKPSNNAFLIDKLRKDGVEITESLSTREALTFLGKNTKDINVIISDMGRFEDGHYQPEAGLKLITSIRDLGIPILIFSSARYARQNGEAVKTAGAKGVTSSSLELLEWLKELGVG